MATLSLLVPACLVHIGLAQDKISSWSDIVDSRVDVSDDFFILDELSLLLFLNAEFCIDDDCLAVDKISSWSDIVDSSLFVHDAYTLDHALLQDDDSMPVSTARVRKEQAHGADPHQRAPTIFALRWRDQRVFLGVSNDNRRYCARGRHTPSNLLSDRTTRA